MENPKQNAPVIFHIATGGPHGSDKDIDLTQMLDDERRRVISVQIRGGSVLKRHHAEQPITVYCVSGTCRFKSGTELDTTSDMAPGTLLALDAGIEHEVEAISDTQLIVSKFK